MPLLEAVLILRKNKLGEDHPETLSSMHNLVIQYSEAGQRAEAVEMSESVLRLQNDMIGEDHPETLISAKLLAYLQEGMNKESPKPATGRGRRQRMSKPRIKIRS